MADKNIEKALHGPSSFEVAVGAVLGIAVGIVASVLYMVFKPVEKVPALPKTLAANTIYVVPGKESTTRARGWQTKLTIFTTGGEILLKEEELNAWGATLSDYKPADPNLPKPPTPPKAAPKQPAKQKSGDKKSPGDPDEETEEKQVFFAASAPNFSIKENRLQIALQCKLDYYGIGQDVWVKVNGHFALSAEGYKFAPDEYYVGSCPLHLIPGGPQIVTNLIVDDLKLSDEVKAAWPKVSILTLEGDQMKVVTKP